MVSADDSSRLPRTDYPATPPADERVSHAIIQAVAAETETDPIVLTPLYDAVDPDALDALFAHAQSAESADLPSMSLSFRYEGLEVTVRGDGDVSLQAGD